MVKTRRQADAEAEAAIPAAPAPVPAPATSGRVKKAAPKKATTRKAASSKKKKTAPKKETKNTHSAPLEGAEPGNENEENTAGDESTRGRKTKQSPPRKISAESGLSTDATEPDEQLEQNWKAFDERQRENANMKIKSLDIDAGRVQQTDESPKKKTRRSAPESRVSEENATIGVNQEDVPSQGIRRQQTSRVSGATGLRGPHPDPVVPTRRSTRTRHVAVATLTPDSEDETFKRPSKKSSEKPEVPENKITNSSEFRFNPRLPNKKLAWLKGTKMKQSGVVESTKATRKRVTDEEKRVIKALTADLIVSEDPGKSVVGALRLRFERRLFGCPGYEILELGKNDSKARTPTLTNAIHPIWAFGNFSFTRQPDGKNRSLNQQTYEAISPALRLASRWIEEPEFEEFWHMLWNGSLSYDEEMNAVIIPARESNGRYAGLIMEPNQERTASLMLRLAELEDLEWKFAPTDDEAVGFSTTEGHVTTLHRSFEYLIQQDPDPSPLTAGTMSGRLRILFFLAVHLCRQLVEHVHHYNWRQEFGTEQPPPRPATSDVYFEADEGTFDYLHHAWETFMFTGPIVQINPARKNTVTCSDGLAIALGRRAREWRGASPKTFAALHMPWINDVFRTTFWSRKKDSRYHPLLPDGQHVPYCAAGPFVVD